MGRAKQQKEASVFSAPPRKRGVTYARVPDPYTDERGIRHLPAIPEDESGECPHPLLHHWGWYAYDGTFCVACCACGAVLRGGETLREDKQ